MTARLPTRVVEKPWGQDVLPPPFTSHPGTRVGEVWFEPPAALPDLLVKYLFTSEPLSVQVHPAGARGKDECWLVLTAEPGARLGVGLTAPMDRGAVRAAALDGSIEQLLAWFPVVAGDFIYLPGGTIHAIGGGLSLVEVQQNADVTYRLYDYGRPRELHLDAGLAVAECRPHDPALRRHLPPAGSFALVDGPHFRLDRIDGPPDAATCARYAGGPLLVVPIEGTATVSGEAIAPGSCALAPDIAAVGAAGFALIAQSVATAIPD